METKMSKQQTPSRDRGTRTGSGHWLRTAAVSTALIMLIVVPPQAQVQGVAQFLGFERDVVPARVGRGEVQLLVGRSTLLSLDRPVTRVSVTEPDIADAMVTSAREVLVHGKAPGTISLLVWQDGGSITNFDVVVRRDLTSLEDRMRQLFPTEPIVVGSNGTSVVVSGIVSSKYVVDNAAALAAGYVETPEAVVNLLRQDEGVASRQVMLQVRFAEVSRTALQELGVSFFTGMDGSNNWLGRTTTQQFPAPNLNQPDESVFDQGSVIGSFGNIFAFSRGDNIGAIIQALETEGVFQSLAEPNLITQNGKEATFLAGGEYPYPVLQGSGLNAAVTIIFKEFGVRLRFTPTIIGDDLIQLQVAPEVSALDFSNAITLQGFRVPALSTRRTETQVELRDGQTFAVAGLLDNTVTESMSKVPGLGDIPILGYLFRSRAYQKNQTELVVMITPHIIQPQSTGVAENLPNLLQPFLPTSEELLPPPAPWSGPSAPETMPETSEEERATTRPDTPAAPVATPALAAPAPLTLVDPTLVAYGSVRPIGRELDLDDERDWLEAELEEAARLRRADLEAAKRLAKAEAKRQEVERQEAERLREVERKEAERQAKVDAKRLEAERREAERLRKAEAKVAERAAEVARREAKAAEKLAREEAKQAAEIAKRDAKAAEKLAREEAKQAAEIAKRDAKAAEKLAREEAKQAAKIAKRDAEAAERFARAEAKRLEAERREAERVAKAEREAAARARTADAKLAREQAEREADLQAVLDEYLAKLNAAQRAIDEVESERSRLVIPVGGAAAAARSDDGDGTPASGQQP